MGFNCIKAIEPLQGNRLFFNSKPPGDSESSQKDERLSRLWSHPMILSLNREFSTLTLVYCPIEGKNHCWKQKHYHIFQNVLEPPLWYLIFKKNNQQNCLASPNEIMRKLPSKHLLVLKTSLRPLQYMSWRRLEDILQDVLKTSWKHLGRQKIVTLEMSSRRLEDMSWRRLEEIMVTNKKLSGDICI